MCAIRPQWPLRDETRQSTPAPDSVKECDTLGLSTESHLSARCSVKSEIHKVAADAAPLIRRIDKNLWNGREEIAVREEANTPDELAAVPRADVRCARKGRGGVAQ